MICVFVARLEEMMYVFITVQQCRSFLQAFLDRSVNYDGSRVGEEVFLDSGVIK
jgi:hypothetical protein